MAAKRDYYEVLGVSRTAGTDEIKSQYRKLALKFHPDRNKSNTAQEHFKEITEAYAVLSDTQKRSVYDQSGHAGVNGQYSQEDIFSGSGFGDIFQNIFSGGFDPFGGGRRQDRGQDIMREVTVDLEDVLHGKTIHMSLDKEVACNGCNGSGCTPGTTRRRCRTCQGHGQIRKTRQMGFASFVVMDTCPKCRGNGAITEHPCNRCRGSGHTRGTQSIEFEIPKGSETADYRIGGEGHEIPGGVNGDLIVRLQVRRHPVFRRDGSDLHYDHHVSMVDAALGGKFDIPLLGGGKTTVKVDAGTQPNFITTIRGKGLPKDGKWGGRGDMHARIVVDIPKKLSRKQKRLLEEFRYAY